MATIDRCPSIVFMLCTVAVGCAEQQPEKPKPKTYTKAEVLAMIIPGESPKNLIILAEAKSALFPQYESILADPKVSLDKKACVYSILHGLKCKDRRFYPYVVEHLQNAECLTLRVFAKFVLWHIATVDDVPPLSALLNDGATSSPKDTARVLSKIGDQNALNALNVWLTVRGPDHDTEFVDHVTQSRDRLKARLDKMEQPNDEE